MPELQEEEKDRALADEEKNGEKVKANTTTKHKPKLRRTLDMPRDKAICETRRQSDEKHEAQRL